jgi:hypothetical protein
LALITCPECEKEVWSGADTCPSCAFPLDSWDETGETGKIQRWDQGGESSGAVARSHPAEVKLVALKKIVTRLGIALPLFVTGAGFEAPPAIIIALLMGGSCIPIWWKSRKEASAEGSFGGLVNEDQLTGVIRDIEDRNQRHVEEMQEQHSQRLMDLEERIDFAERLLTRRNEAGDDS